MHGENDVPDLYVQFISVQDNKKSIVSGHLVLMLNFEIMKA